MILTIEDTIAPHAISNSERTRLYRLANPGKRKANDAAYRERNRDKVRESSRRSDAKRRSEDPERFREIGRRKAMARRSTSRGRLEHAISSGVYASLKGTKSGRATFSLLGYTLDDLISHLESKFMDGMTWENYGEWHVDHVIPLAAHSYTAPDDLDFKRAWALSNLQPLWAIDNMKKSDKLPAAFQPSLAF